MTTVHIPVDLGAEAASSIETVAGVLERELNHLEYLAEAAGPAVRDDPDFQRFRQQLRASLVALRGLGLLLTDEQAKQCRHLWEAAYLHTSSNLGGCPLSWFAAVQSLAGVLPAVEEAQP
jgi:hypothetical protein